MQVDEIITAVTQADSYDDAMDRLHMVPRVVLLAIADQLHVETDCRGNQTIKRAIVSEARS